MDEKHEEGFRDAIGFLLHIRNWFSFAVAETLWDSEQDWDKPGEKYNHLWFKFISCNRDALTFYMSCDQRLQKKLYDWYLEDLNKKL